MTRELTIVQVNDTHGYLEPHPELFWHGDHAEFRVAGGYARIAALLQQIRRERPGKVLAFDCGDTLHGTYVAVQTQGMVLVPILNALDLDAMTVHWEFAYGPGHAARLAEELKHPILAINCYRRESGDLFFTPWIVKEVNGLLVGIIGIASNIVDKVMPPSYSEGVYFTLGNEELPSCIAALKEREGADLIVVVSHLGFPQEMQLAGEVDGIDVLLSAHTHNRLYEPAIVNDTILIQSGCHGSFLGRLDIQVEDGRIADFSHRLVTVGEEVPPDPAVEGMVNRAVEPYRDELNRIVGSTPIALHRYAVLESTMDNLLLQSLLDCTGADLAFSNGWRFGAPVPPGPLTANDLYNIVPMNPPLSTVELTGLEISRMLEENLERTFSRDPYRQMGGYVKRCMGLTLYAKIENPEGHRIQELFVRGERVRPDATYTAAYITPQGVPAKYGSNRRHLDIRAVEAMERYLARGTPDAALRGTVVAV